MAARHSSLGSSKGLGPAPGKTVKGWWARGWGDSRVQRGETSPVFAQVMKNWQPLLLGPLLACAGADSARLYRSVPACALVARSSQAARLPPSTPAHHGTRLGMRSHLFASLKGTATEPPHHPPHTPWRAIYSCNTHPTPRCTHHGQQPRTGVLAGEVLVLEAAAIYTQRPRAVPLHGVEKRAGFRRRFWHIKVHGVFFKGKGARRRPPLALGPAGSGRSGRWRRLCCTAACMVVACPKKSRSQCSRFAFSGANANFELHWVGLQRKGVSIEQ